MKENTRNKVTINRCAKLIYYLSLVTALRPFGDVMVDQVEDGPEAWQVVVRQSSGVQPESATRIVDSDASRPFVRLQTEGVQVAGVGRIADEKRSNLSMATRRNDVEKPIPILM